MTLPTDIEYCNGGSVMLHFGATQYDNLKTLPLGHRSSVIYSPSPYIVGLGWRRVCYIIALHVMPRERLEAAREYRVPIAERCYEVVETRLLTDDEIADVLEGLPDRSPLHQIQLVQFLHKLKYELSPECRYALDKGVQSDAPADVRVEE